jgi:predicted transposase/invertase (TIGR01784 family)
VTIPTNPHDHFFKAIFTRPETAGDFLRHYLPPEVIQRLDLARLTICKNSFVDAELAEHHSDLLYQVPLTAGRQSYVYILFEHKSYPEPFIALALLRYMLRIWEQWRKEDHPGRLPPILPIVIYHGRRPWRVATDFAALIEVPDGFAPFVPNFRYLLTDLSRYQDEEIRGAVIVRAALLLFKYIFSDELRARLPAILGLLNELAQQQTGLEYVEAVLRYVVGAADTLSPDELRQAVRQALTKGDTIMPTIAEQWVQQGLQQGLEQGLQQGIPQGEALVLKRQLARRFGPLPEWVEARLAQAEQGDLETWADRVLDAKNLEEVFNAQ